MTRSTLASTLLVVAALAVSPARAQAPRSEAALKDFFEGMRVVVKIDMPGDSGGVDVRMDRPFDRDRYESRVKTYGTALLAGDVVTVTLVKVKDDVIEFQLDGGGFGTFGDDTSTYVDMPLVEKSNRERDLEQLVRRETDAGRKRQLQRELDDLKNARERENRRITSEKNLAEQQKRRLVVERRRAGGSRFNIRYPKVVPADITSRDVITTLSEYVDFSPPAGAVGQTGRDDRPSGGDGLPRKGMSRADLEDLFGRPMEVSNRREGAFQVTTLVFVRAGQRITAELVEDVLIRYTIASR